MPRNRNRALIPAAARHLEKADTSLPALLNKILSDMEEELGGRATLLDILSRSSDGTMSAFATLMMDPANRNLPLGEMCATAGVTTGQILRAYQDGVMLYAQTLSKKSVAEHLPAVTKDVMIRATPQEGTCEACDGNGTLVPPRTRKNPNPQPEQCKRCKGTGVALILPDLERQKVALDLGDMLPKKAGINVGVGITNNVSQSNGRGHLEKLQQAVSDILYSDQTVLNVPESPRE